MRASDYMWLVALFVISAGIVLLLSGCTMGIGANIDWTLGRPPPPPPVIIVPSSKPRQQAVLPSVPRY